MTREMRHHTSVFIDNECMWTLGELMISEGRVVEVVKIRRTSIDLEPVSWWRSLRYRFYRAWQALRLKV